LVSGIQKASSRAIKQEGKPNSTSRSVEGSEGRGYILPSRTNTYSREIKKKMREFSTIILWRGRKKGGESHTEGKGRKIKFGIRFSVQKLQISDGNRKKKGSRGAVVFPGLIDFARCRGKEKNNQKGLGLV